MMGGEITMNNLVCLTVKELLVIIKHCSIEGNLELQKKALEALASKNGGYRKELRKI
jgi:hypothetical protein